jgi:membrane protein required for colicin V production
MLVLVFLPTLLPVDQDSWWKQSLLISYLLQFESWSSEFFASVGAAVAGLFGRI